MITLVPMLAPVPPFVPHYSFADISAVVWNPVTFDLLKSNPRFFFSRLMDFAVPFYPILSGVCYSILFFSSTPYTESITIKKYPKAYAAYQKRVGIFSPIGTFEKKLWLSLVSGEKELKEVDQLVYGTGKGKAKAE